MVTRPCLPIEDARKTLHRRKANAEPILTDTQPAVYLALYTNCANTSRDRMKTATAAVLLGLALCAATAQVCFQLLVPLTLSSRKCGRMRQALQVPAAPQFANVVTSRRAPAIAAAPTVFFFKSPAVACFGMLTTSMSQGPGAFRWASGTSLHSRDTKCTIACCPDSAGTKQGCC